MLGRTRTGFADLAGPPQAYGLGEKTATTRRAELAE